MKDKVLHGLGHLLKFIAFQRLTVHFLSSCTLGVFYSRLVNLAPRNVPLPRNKASLRGYYWFPIILVFFPTHSNSCFFGKRGQVIDAGPLSLIAPPGAVPPAPLMATVGPAVEKVEKQDLMLNGTLVKHC